MGSLYSSNRPKLEQIAWFKHLSLKTRFVRDSEFAVGRVGSIPFFYGNRIPATKWPRARSKLHSITCPPCPISIISFTTSRKIAATADDEYDRGWYRRWHFCLLALPNIYSPLTASLRLSPFIMTTCPKTSLLTLSPNCITGIVD